MLSANGGTSISTQKYYTPYYRDPPKRQALTLGTPLMLGLGMCLVSFQASIQKGGILAVYSYKFAIRQHIIPPTRMLQRFSVPRRKNWRKLPTGNPISAWSAQHCATAKANLTSKERCWIAQDWFLSSCTSPLASSVLSIPGSFKKVTSNDPHDYIGVYIGRMENRRETTIYYNCPFSANCGLRPGDHKLLHSQSAQASHWAVDYSYSSRT